MHRQEDVAEELAYIRQRMMDVDVEMADLDGIDLSSPEVQVAVRHGMATAFHEVEHRLMERAEMESVPA
jgi:hypothetical protein